MADSEYGREFRILLTAHHGLKTITNPAWIRMLDAVTDGAKTTAQLSSELGIPRSTVQQGIASMVSDGIIGSCRSGEDSRKVIHYFSSIAMVRSITEEAVDPREWDAVVRNVITDSGGPPYGLLFIFVAVLRSCGVDASNILFEAGLSVGDLYMEYYPDNPFRTMGDEVTQVTGIREGISIDVDPAQGVTIRVGNMGNAVFTEIMCYLVAGFVWSLVRRRLGIVCVPILDFEHSKVYTDARMRIYGDIPLRVVPIADHRSDYYKVDSPMAVYISSEGPCLVCNRNMVSVMDALFDKPLSISGIAAATGIREITVYSTLSRLEDLGIVEKMSGDRVQIYSVSCRKILRRVGQEPENIVLEIPPASCPRRNLFNRLVYRYVMWSVEKLGFSGEHIFDIVGRSVARSLVSMDGTISPQSYLDMVCSIHSGNRMELELETYIPLTVVLTTAPVPEGVIRYTIQYLEGLIKEGLRMTTGEDYSVTVVHRIRASNRCG